MYIPNSFKNENIEQLHQFIEKFNFATLISNDNGESIISHIPVMLDRKKGQYGTLIWHVANLNLHATDFNKNKNATFIFHGPHSYISHTWYKTFPNVPTWNYAVVHAHGVPQSISKEELMDDLTKMVTLHESRVDKNSDYSIAEEYKRQLVEHITGFRMEITKFEGKFKLGQNRSLEDQSSMLQGLRKQNTSDSIALADFIEGQT